MTILVLSRYGNLGATSRLRFFQYFKVLESSGFQFVSEPLFTDDYVKGLFIKPTPILSVLKSYYRRLNLLIKKGKYDLIWVEKEIFPWLPSWFELSILPKKVPLIIDYDDATFHRYDQFPFYPVRILLGRKIDHLMKNADVIVAGNNYIRERALNAGSIRVEYLPTVVDTDAYSVKTSLSAKITIGWIGSPSTARYLYLIRPAIQELAKNSNVNFITVGAHDHQVKNLPVENYPWSEDTEISRVQSFDIGIMPLPDEPFERGKCGFKLIQYMACGKPVVASPVGVNIDIVNEGENGFLATFSSQWIEKLKILIDDADLRRKMGLAGRQLVEQNYSLHMAADKLVNIFNSLHTKPNSGSIV